MSPVTVLLQGIPPKTLIGLDLVSFNCSPTFTGIRNITPGYHFLYTGTDASLAIRRGHWFQVPIVSRESASPLLTWHWNAEDEALDRIAHTEPQGGQPPIHVSASQQSGLIDYPALLGASSDTKKDDEKSSLDDWRTLTSHVTTRLLNRIIPGSETTQAYSISSVSTASADSEHIPGLSSTERDSAFSELGETPLGFLPIDLKKTWADGAVGRERTDGARDRSWYLRFMIDGLRSSSAAGSRIDRKEAASELLGEMQFTFLMVLTLANYSCLEQWKRILSVLMKSRTGLSEVQGFFVETVRVLRLQMGHCEDVEGGLFELREPESSSWLRRLLMGFKGNVEEMLGGKGELAEEWSELEDLMREKYGWEVDAAMLKRGVVQLEDGEQVEISMDGADEEDEEGEYAPIVVDIGEGIVAENGERRD